MTTPVVEGSSDWLGAGVVGWVPTLGVQADRMPAARSRAKAPRRARDIAKPPGKMFSQYPTGSLMPAARDVALPGLFTFAGYDPCVLPRRRTARALIALFATLSVLLVAVAAAPTHLDLALGWLAYPLLAQVLYVSTDPPRKHAVRLALWGFLLTGAADASLIIAGVTGPAVEMTLNASAMACWGLALWPLRADSVLVTRRGWLVLYAGVVTTAMLAAATGAGILTPLALALLAAAGAMAVLATSLGLPGIFGGFAILLAHSLTVLVAFVPAWDRPALPIWIAALSLGGGGLVLGGFVRRFIPEKNAGTTGAPVTEEPN